MRYFLKISKLKKGDYLQIYESEYFAGKGGRNKSFKALGYVEELKKKDIKNPVEYYKKEVARMNDELKAKYALKITSKPVEIYLGHFVLNSLLNELNVKETMGILSRNKRFQFDVFESLKSLIFAQIINPTSKYKTREETLPSLYGAQEVSYDQLLETVEFLGEHQSKIIQLFNFQYEKFFKRDYTHLLFDCTNYYFEIDVPDEDKQKGPSKENRKGPIIGQALLLDANQIPITMEMFPGNCSEKGYIRKMIDDTKKKYGINGRTIQIADKGLNCAKNIYSAAVLGNDGYIYSQKIKSNAKINAYKNFVLGEDEPWTEFKSANGKLSYKLKSRILENTYTLDDGEKFTVKQKWVGVFNASLRSKQLIEINKQIDKATKLSSIKVAEKEEYGDAVKYVSFQSVDKNGEKTKIVPVLNQSKINEDLELAGYSVLITSEINMTEDEIYQNYHRLWKIEESFRVMKTYLEARPVFLTKAVRIYGHFLICYLALFLTRILEINVLSRKISDSKIIEFIRNFRFANYTENEYVNLSTENRVLKEIASLTGLTILDNLYLTKKQIKSIYEADLALENIAKL